MCKLVGIYLPETNSKFAPENGWLEYHHFLLGRLICRGYVSFQGNMFSIFLDMDTRFEGINFYKVCFWLGDDRMVSKLMCDKREA